MLYEMMLYIEYCYRKCMCTEILGFMGNVVRKDIALYDEKL